VIENDRAEMEIDASRAKEMTNIATIGFEEMPWNFIFILGSL
jgi:hypothetical protein